MITEEMPSRISIFLIVTKNSDWLAKPRCILWLWSRDGGFESTNQVEYMYASEAELGISSYVFSTRLIRYVA